MAADFKTFLTTYALYLVICTVILLFFGIFRRSKVAYKFYNPARFDEIRAKRRPKPLPPSLFGWIRDISRYGQADLVTVAGYDAACFLRVLAFGTELFSFLAVWCLLVVLPTNISGNQVDVLIGRNNVPTSEFTYWVPPSPPPYPPGEKPPPSSGPPQMIKAPDFYDKNIPPAPAGLQWWRYKADVPPLPDPATFFNGSKKYRGYGWKYDSGYSANDYVFTNLDVTSMTNIGKYDHRLWVHLVSTWVVSLYLWKLLWRYNKDAVIMRIQFLMEAERRVEACTVLVRDIPGCYYGTVADRIERTALRFLPAVVKRRIVQFGGKTLENVGRGVDATVTNISQVVLPDGTVSTPPNMGVPTPARVPHADVPTAPGTQEEIGPGESAPGAIPTELAAEEAAARSHANGVSTEEFVKEQFNAVFENQVEQVQVCYNTRALDKLVAEYNGTLVKLQDELDDYISLDKRRKKIKRRKTTVVGLQYGQWGVDNYGTSPTRVDTLELYPRRLKALLEEIRDAQKDCLPPNEDAMPAAFVTFSKRKCQIDAAGGMFHHDRSAWITDPAPGPEEIIWKNLGWRKWERAIRFTLIWTLFFAIVIFYIPIVSAVQGLLQLDKLQELPGVRKLTSLPLVSSLLQAFLPSLVLRIFLVVLPYLLAYMGRVEGLVSLSAVQFSVVKKLFTFQFLTVFLTSLIAGTILGQLQEFLQNPSSLVSSLGAAAPQTATFFMLYLLLTGLIAKPIQFLRFPGLLLLHFQTWMAHTERAKARLWEQQYVDYGWEVPDCCIAILLGLVFCIIQPLMTPIALSYFLVNSILYKYQLIYVHKPQFESGGMVWTQVFDHVMVAALAFQVIMLGLLFLQGGLLLLLLLLPLPLMFLAAWAGASDLFRRPLKLLSQKAAADIDRMQKDELSPEEVREAEAYRHPAFKIDEKELVQLLEEAEKVEELLAMPDFSPGLLAKALGEREKDIEEGDEGDRLDSVREVLLPDRAD